MRLKILLNLGAGLPPYTEGQEVDERDERVAAELLRIGVAVQLPEVDTPTEAPEVATEVESTPAESTSPTAARKARPRSKNKES